MLNDERAGSFSHSLLKVYIFSVPSEKVIGRCGRLQCTYTENRLSDYSGLIFSDPLEADTFVPRVMSHICDFLMLPSCADKQIISAMEFWLCLALSIKLLRWTKKVKQDFVYFNSHLYPPINHIHSYKSMKVCYHERQKERPGEKCLPWWPASCRKGWLSLLMLDRL